MGCNEHAPADEQERTVIVTVDAPEGLLPALEAHARYGLSRFREFEGFLSGVLHRSDDGKRMVQVVRWASEADYRRCIDSPIWDDLPSTRRFMDTVSSGQARMDVRLYRVVATGNLRRP